MSHPNLETARLLLRPVTPEDDRAVFRWCGDPKVNKFMISPLYHNPQVGNPASGRVMEKLGLRCVGDTRYHKQDGSVTFPAKAYRWEAEK